MNCYLLVETGSKTKAFRTEDLLVMDQLPPKVARVQDCVAGTLY
jgi:hypothetical protein